MGGAAHCLRLHAFLFLEWEEGGRGEEERAERGERGEGVRGGATPLGGAASPPLARRCFLTLLCWAVIHRVALLGRADFLPRSFWVVLPLLPGNATFRLLFLLQLLPPTDFLYLSNIHLNVFIHLVCVHLYIYTQSKHNICVYRHM